MIFNPLRSFIASTLFLSLSSLVSQGALASSILGYHGPLVESENAGWKEFRTLEKDPVPTPNSSDASCGKLPVNLRQLLFEHFRYYVDHSKSKVTETEIARFAKVAGMTLYESSGASAAVTDMSRTGSQTTLRLFFGRDNSSRTGVPGRHSSLASIDQLMAMKYETRTPKKGRSRTYSMKWDHQTNFGLLQMSADRLGRSDTGELARGMIADMKERFLSHPDEVIDRCGTKIMFKDSEADIRHAFRKLQACKPGMKDKAGIQCFGRWATLCPNYNISLALVATPAYFETRRKPPLCAKTFRRILYNAQTKASSTRKTPTPKKSPTSVKSSTQENPSSTKEASSVPSTTKETPASSVKPASTKEAPASEKPSTESKPKPTLLTTAANEPSRPTVNQALGRLSGSPMESSPFGFPLFAPVGVFFADEPSAFTHFDSGVSEDEGSAFDDPSFRDADSSVFDEWFITQANG